MVPGAPVAVAAPTPPSCDDNLPARVQEIYRNLIAWAIAAKVQVKQIDSVTFTGAARCLYTIERAEGIMEEPDASPDAVVGAMKMIDSADRRLQKWLDMICASPGARARLGQKPEPEKKGGALADLLARRQARGA